MHTFKVSMPGTGSKFRIHGLNKDEIFRALWVTEPEIIPISQQTSPALPLLQVTKNFPFSHEITQHLGKLNNDDVISCFGPKSNSFYFRDGAAKLSHDHCPAQVYLHRNSNVVFPGPFGAGISWALEQERSFVIHGLAFQYGNSGYLCIGDSQSGKSTLASAVIQSGGQVVSDDTVVLRQGNDDSIRIGPLRPNIVLRKGGKKALPEEAQAQLVYSSMSNREERWILNRNHFTQYFTASTTLSQLLILNSANDQTRPKHSTLTPIHHSEAITQLIRHSANLHVKTAQTIVKQLKLAEQIVKKSKPHKITTGSSLLDHSDEELLRVLSKLPSH